MKRLLNPKLCTSPNMNMRHVFNVNPKTVFKYGHYSAPVAVVSICAWYLHLLANHKHCYGRLHLFYAGFCVFKITLTSGSDCSLRSIVCFLSGWTRIWSKYISLLVERTVKVYRLNAKKLVDNMPDLI